MTIDLHTHSTASDGTQSPAEVISTAHDAGIDVIALTDHDTTQGWAEAVEALRPGMTLVPGAEMSCRYDLDGVAPVAMHLLAYLFDPGAPLLRDRLAGLRTDRIERARRMVARMAADGVPVSWADVHGFARGGTVGRPHLARALVSAGVVPSVDAAFAGPLSSRSPYYLRKVDIPVFEAIGLVHAAGGVCVFAHPRRRGRQVDDAGIARLAEAGLNGLEVDHPDHDPATRRHLTGLADELGLVRTGSSDYHGTNKRTLIGACLTAPDQLAALIAPARSVPIVG